MKRAMGINTALVAAILSFILILCALPAGALAPLRWSEVNLISEDLEAKGVGIDLDGRDRANIVWTEGEGPYNIYFSRVDFDNKIINHKTRIGSTATNEWIDCISDGDDQVHVLYLDSGSIKHIKLGVTGIKVVNERTVVGTGSVASVSYAMDGKGNIHIVFSDGDGIDYIGIGENGENAVFPKTLSDSGSFPDIGIDGNGLVVVSFLDPQTNEMVLNTYDGDMNAVSSLNLSVGNASIRHPRLEVEESGGLMLFWTGDGDGLETGSLMMSRLDPLGKVVIVNKKLFQDVFREGPFSAEADGEGRVHLLWYGKDDGWKVNYGMVNTNGEALIAPLWISEPDAPREDGPGFDLEPDEHGYAHVAWSRAGIKYIHSRPAEDKEEGPLTRDETLALIVILMTVAWLFIVHRWILGIHKKDARRLNPIYLLRGGGKKGKNGKGSSGK